MQKIAFRRKNINWLEIINNIFDPSKWNKQHLIYSRGCINVSCIVESFNFLDKSTLFKILINYQRNNKIESHKFTIEYYSNNEKIERFIYRFYNKLLNELMQIKTFEHEQEARQYLNLKNVYFWNLTEADVIENDDKKSLDIIKKLPKEDYDQYFGVLTRKICSKIDMKQDLLIDNYRKSIELDFDDLNLAIEQIKIEKDKNEPKK